MLDTALLVAVLIVAGFAAWRVSRVSTETADPRLKNELERRIQENGELKKDLENVLSEKNELAGKGKQLFAEITKLEAKLENTLGERDTLKKQVTQYEAEERRMRKELDTQLSELANAKRSFEEERQRVIREEEKRRAEDLEEHDRMWAGHENDVVSLLTDLCKKKEYAFPSFDNTNLPEGFHGNLKPDFLIEFLGQYIIFDAKVSKASNLQTYISEQVKSTAKKVKGKDTIYPRIFLVVPTHAIGELKKTSFYEEGFTFFVVSPEALEPILAALKRITEYELAETMDPQERENIVDLIAQFDFHISTRNAAELFLMQHGIETLGKTNAISPDLAKEVAIKKAKMRVLSQKSSDQKQFIANPELVKEHLFELVAPKSQIQKEDIDRLKN